MTETEAEAAAKRVVEIAEGRYGVYGRDEAAEVLAPLEAARLAVVEAAAEVRAAAQDAQGYAASTARSIEVSADALTFLAVDAAYVAFSDALERLRTARRAFVIASRRG